MLTRNENKKGEAIPKMRNEMPKIDLKKLKVGTQIFPLSNWEVIQAYKQVLDMNQWRSVLRDDCVIALPQDSEIENQYISRELIALSIARLNPNNIH